MSRLRLWLGFELTLVTNHYTSGINRGIHEELGRVLSRDRLFLFLFFVGSESAIEAEHDGLQSLVIQLGFAEQNIASMQLLFAIFGCFAARLIGLFLGLRFEPNFLFALFRS